MIKYSDCIVLGARAEALRDEVAELAKRLPRECREESLEYRAARAEYLAALTRYAQAVRALAVQIHIGKEKVHHDVAARL